MPGSCEPCRVGSVLCCVLTFLAAVATQAERDLPPPAPAAYTQPGDDTYIAVFAGLHRPPSRQLSPAAERNSTASTVPRWEAAACGGVAWRGVQQAAAAEWALKAINHQTITNHSIGLQVLDTCGDATIALQQLLALVSRTAEAGAPALIGVVAVGGTAETSALHPLLTSLSVPLLVTSVEASYELTPSPVLFSASPHLETLMKCVVAVVGQMLMSGSGNTRVTVLWSSSKAMRELQTEVGRAGLVIGGEKQLIHPDPAASDRSSPSLREQIVEFQRNNRLINEDVVILLLTLQEARLLQTDTRGTLSRMPKLRWLLASAEDDPWAHEQDIIELSEELSGLVVVGSHSPHLSALQQHLADEVCDDSNILHQDSDFSEESELRHKMHGKLGKLNNVGSAATQPRSPPTNEVWSSSRIKFADFSSSPLDSPKSSILWPVLREYCQIISGQKSGDGLSRLTAVDATHSAAALRAVSTLAAAFRMVQLDHCPEQVNCTEVFDNSVHQEVVDKLGTLSYDVQEGADRLRFTIDARLSTAYSVVTVVSETVVQIGHYLERSGMQWIEVPEPLSSSQTKQKEQLDEYQPRLSKPLVARRPLHTVHHLQSSSWRATTWSVIICVAAAAGIVCCFLVATYIAIRTCDGTLGNTEVPGVLILVGTSLVFVGSIITVLPVPVYDLAVMCCLQHVLPYVATALTYAALLTKALHVLVLNAMRVHSKIPAAVLYLPLAALVALAMLLAALGDSTTLHFILPNEVASLTARAPGSNHSRPGTSTERSSFVSEAQFAKDVREEDAYEFTRIQLCKRPEQIPTLMGFAYLIVVLIVTLIILCSTKSTNNAMKGFHECRRMMALCCVSVPLVLLWGAASLCAPLHLQQPLVALSLVLVAYVVLGLILIPQLYRISSRKGNQFSHKPLSGGSSPISTVFKSHATTMTPNFTHPVVAYTSRGDEDGCRFSDIYLGCDFAEKNHSDNLSNWKILQPPNNHKYVTNWNPMNGIKIPRHEGFPKIPQRSSFPIGESPTRNKQHMETFR